MEESTSRLITQISDEFGCSAILHRRFPQIVHPGLLQGEVHPTFVTYLAILGHELGYYAVAELPISNRSKQIFHDKTGINKREPDSVWLRAEGFKPVLFAEYEGIEDERGFESKLRSLIEAFNDAEQKPACLLLAWWRKQGQLQAMEFARAQKIYTKGFAHPSTGILVPPPPVPLLIWEACFRSVRERWTFTHFTHTSTWNKH